MQDADPRFPSEPPRRPGRPPSAAARQKVLETALRILLDEGLGRLTIDRVALASGVGKPTIYRTWANAQELAMAAFMAAPAQDLATPAGRSVQRALVAHLAAVVAHFDSARGRQITLTMAAADAGSELAKAFRNQVILQSREVGRALIERGIASGELRRPADIEVALDMVYGPLFYRLLAGHLALPAGFAQQLVETLVRGLAGRR